MLRQQSLDLFPIEGGRQEAKPFFDQRKLDILDKSRSSLLPWRGQFSPELVEYLLKEFCRHAGTIYDPFCGSGTVLAEAAGSGRIGVGSEVSPAAFIFSSAICAAANARDSGLEQQLLAIRNDRSWGPDDLIQEIKANSYPVNVASCLSAAVLLASSEAGTIDCHRLRGTLFQLFKMVKILSTCTGTATCTWGDARCTEIIGGSVDAIITSPPYINVFNYHQNYRRAAERLGWTPLSTARAEVGANRKNRQNRYLTVIEYCMDMALVLNEFSRVCRPGATFIIIIGRESNVLETPFYNGILLRKLLQKNDGLSLGTVGSRKFTNRFGKAIYEEIILGSVSASDKIHQETAREIGRAALIDAHARAPEKNKPSLLAAVRDADLVRCTERHHGRPPAYWAQL